MCIQKKDEYSWRRKWQSTPVLLPGKSYGQRSLAGYSPWGHKELDTTERPFFFMVYESNKNFVCSCLLKYTENKMPKQEEVKSVLSFISYQQSMLL